MKGPAHSKKNGLPVSRVGELFSPYVAYMQVIRGLSWSVSPVFAFVTMAVATKRTLFGFRLAAC